MKIVSRTILASACFVAIFSTCKTDSSATTSTPTVPDSLKPPKTEKLSFSLAAKGVQIYECQAEKEMSPKFKWVFKAPEADLFDASKKVGKH
jgi:Protein of unknown function (DUF3455)